MAHAGEIEFLPVFAMVSQKRGVIGGNGEEQSWAVALDIGVDVFRSGTAGRKNAGRAHGERKISGVSEPVGKEQFGHAITTVVLADAQNAFCVKLRTHHYIVMEMHATLWSRGAAGGIEPECRIIFASRFRLQIGRGCFNQLAKVEKSAGRLSNEYGCFQIAKFLSWNLLPLRKQNFADYCDSRPSVIQQMLILVRFEESIDGNGHRADLDCAKKAVKKFGNVGNQQKNALFGAHTQPTKRVAHAVCVREQMTIGDTFVAAFNRDLFSSAFGNIAINKVSGNVELFR